MATKNLARTAIEGGRASANKWDRRHSNRQVRRRVRQYLDAVTRDVEMADERVSRSRRKVYKGFDDKLGPPERWLRSNLGRPWNKVRSELLAKLDTRTIAGRHIVYDHMLAWVQVHQPREPFTYARFFVDRHGILRENKSRRTRHYDDWIRLPPGKERRSAAEIEAWAGGRKVAMRGSIWFWCVPTRLGSFRQAYPLSGDEVSFWDTLVGRIQVELIHEPAHNPS